MYDFSLLEKYTGVEYHVEVFNLMLQEDRTKLETVMKTAATDTKMKVQLRKDYHNEKTGDILVHIEWFCYLSEAVSPFAIETQGSDLHIKE